MEQFNLEEWLKDKSRKICTRDGRLVRIVCWDSPNKAFPIVGFINNNSTVFVWDNYGYSKSGNVESKNDLFFEDEEENLSEDERIRKEIYRYFRDLQLSSDREFSPSTSIDEILAWLEKQVEPKFNVGDIISDGISEVEIVSIDENKYNVTNSEIEDDANICNWVVYFRDQKKWKLVDRSYSEENKKHLQSNQEWSEEDEKMLNDIIDTIHDAISYCDVDDIGMRARFSYENEIKWLNSLKYRVQSQPKQELSEYNEKMISLLIKIFEVNHPNEHFKVNPIGTTSMEAISTKEIVDWIKSLKPQNHWKPSKEQMETLKFAANDYCMGETKKNLESLYNDLKKL